MAFTKPWSKQNNMRQADRPLCFCRCKGPEVIHQVPAVNVSGQVFFCLGHLFSAFGHFVKYGPLGLCLEGGFGKISGRGFQVGRYRLKFIKPCIAVQICPFSRLWILGIKSPVAFFFQPYASFPTLSSRTFNFAISSSLIETR
jgi:hypothetical protein